MSGPWSMVIARWPFPSSAAESWPGLSRSGIVARIGAQAIRGLEIHDQKRNRTVGLGLQNEAAVEFQRRAEQRRQHDRLAEQLADRRPDNRAWSECRRARGRAGSGGRADRAQLTSNGSTASSTGTADGARIGGSLDILMSGDCEVMALYLGSVSAKRKGRHASDPAVDLTSMLRRRSRREEARVCVPAFAATSATTLPPRNTTPECPFAHAGDFPPRRTPPIAGRRSPRR